MNENRELRRKNEQLTDDLRKARMVIDVQKKVAMLLGVPVEVSKSEELS